MNETLIEMVVGAWREVTVTGEIKQHPAWWDLDESARIIAHEVAVQQRTIEAALDANGLSSTSRAVLNRIKGTR